MIPPSNDPVGDLFHVAKLLTGKQRDEFLARVEHDDPGQAEELRLFLAAKDRNASGDGLLKELPAAKDEWKTHLPISKVLPGVAGRDSTTILLHRRLFYAMLISFVVLAVFFVKDFFDEQAVGGLWISFPHGVAVAVCGIVAVTLIAYRKEWSEASLRLLESVGLIGIVQFIAMHHIFHLELCLPYLDNPTRLEDGFVDATNEAISFR